MRTLVICAPLIASSVAAQAQLGDALKRMEGRGASGNNCQTASGLKEALGVGAKKTRSRKPA